MVKSPYAGDPANSERNDQSNHRHRSANIDSFPPHIVSPLRITTGPLAWRYEIFLFTCFRPALLFRGLKFEFGGLKNLDLEEQKMHGAVKFPFHGFIPDTRLRKISLATYPPYKQL